MNLKIVVVTLAIAVLGAGALRAADTRRPDPEAVVRAFFAATNVGNVDASLAFFADDSYHMLPGGKKYSGRDELRKLFDLFARENARFDMPPDAMVKGDTVRFRLNVTTRWLVELGISPTPVIHVAAVDGNKSRRGMPTTRNARWRPSNKPVTRSLTFWHQPVHVGEVSLCRQTWTNSSPKGLHKRNDPSSYADDTSCQCGDERNRKGRRTMGRVIQPGDPWLYSVPYRSPSLVVPAFGDEAPNMSGVPRLAIGGYDTVAYHTVGKAVPGMLEYQTIWHDARWQFASKGNLDLFTKDPEKYAAMYDGHCAMGVAEGERSLRHGGSPRPSPS